MVETQLCKLRGTLDTLVGRAYSIFHLQYGVCELTLRYLEKHARGIMLTRGKTCTSMQPEFQSGMSVHPTLLVPSKLSAANIVLSNSNSEYFTSSKKKIGPTV